MSNKVLPEKAAGKTAVWRAERKCFAWAFSARATNTLQLIAYETKVFVVCAENIGMEKAILRMGWFIFALEFAKCVKHFLPPGILLCAVTKLKTRLDRVLSEGTWQIPKLSAPFCCILFWGGGDLKDLNRRTNLLNYNDTGGWKEAAQKGFARCKESILHNLKL